MRTLLTLLVIATTLSCPVAAQAAPYEIVSTVPLPARTCMGLAFDGANLWTVDVRARALVAFSPKDGAVAARWPLEEALFLTGVCFDGEFLRAVDTRAHEVLVVVPATGEVKERLPLAAAQPTGIQWIAGNHWVLDSAGKGSIAILDGGTAASLKELPAPGPNPYAIAWQGGELWVSNNKLAGQAALYRIDPATGEIVTAFDFPVGEGAANGLELVGGHLFVISSRQRCVIELRLTGDATP